MPTIEKTEGYHYDGKLFATKEEAVREARRKAFQKHGNLEGKSWIGDASLEILLSNFDDLMKELQSIE